MAEDAADRLANGHVYAVRLATLSDAATLTEHRLGMFADMGELPDDTAEKLREACVYYFREAIPRGEYIGWIASADGQCVGGAGVQLRRILPRPQDGAITLGPEAIVLNVYVAPSWRRLGIAARLMRDVLEWCRARGVERVVLHASRDGRALYEKIGFVSTNEMRYVKPETP